MFCNNINYPLSVQLAGFEAQYQITGPLHAKGDGRIAFIKSIELQKAYTSVLISVLLCFILCKGFDYDLQR